MPKQKNKPNWLSIEELNLKIVLSRNLTLDEFIYLYLRWKKESIFAIEFKDRTNVDTDKLINEGWLSDDNKLTFRFVEEFVPPPEEAWEEFRQTYPKKVGGRRFHDNVKGNKLKYINIVATKPTMHEQVMNGLKLELKERKRNDSMSYLTAMSTYINQQRWLTYQDEEVEQEIIDGGNIAGGSGGKAI